MASYRLVVAEQARREIRRAPGSVRQRVLRLLRALEQEPRPPESQQIDTTKDSLSLQPGAELRRLRLAAWRIVYLLEDDPKTVSVLALRKRPPYQYDDLEELLKSI